ncbi:SWI/SNF-related matrix-associated actin-dependent regulator of chromatin subfamily A containing DEAD/H box 1, partial [Fragariocoptes setiger]
MPRVIDDAEIINILDDSVELSHESDIDGIDGINGINRDGESQESSSHQSSQTYRRSISVSPASEVHNTSKRPRVIMSRCDSDDDDDTPIKSAPSACLLEDSTDEIVVVKDRTNSPSPIHDNNEDEFDDDDSKDENVHGSDDDILEELDDDDEGGFRHRTSTKGKKKDSNLKQRVVDFVQNANQTDLETIPGVSKKKALLIIDMRPFRSWEELNRKFESHGSAGISSETILNVVNTIKSRDIVAKLMSDCEKLSRDIANLVEHLPEAKQPKCLNPKMKLKPYQLVGLNWLCLMYQRNINAILADEMGLGKTIQVIAFIAHLRENVGIKQHFLIVVPASTLDNWGREFETWCPDIRTLHYHGNQDERAQIRYVIAKHKKEFDVILTTYNVIQNHDDKKMLKAFNFEYLVFDEAHMLKNMKSLRYQNLIKIKSRRRILLTGTPLQNNLLELMSLLVFTVPRMFMSKMSHIDRIFSSSSTKQEGGRTEYETERIEQAKRIMKPFFFRRLKKDVLTDLPQKVEKTIRCQMTKEQAKLYKKMVESFTQEIRSNEDQSLEADDSFSIEMSSDIKKGAGMLMAMRRISNHPLLMRNHYTPEKLRQMSHLMLREPTHREANPDLILEDMIVMHDFELHMLCKLYKAIERFKLCDNDIVSSGKFARIDILLEEVKRTQQRCLIFSQFVMMLDIMEEYLKIRGHNYVRLDGSTKVSDRLNLIDEFNQNDGVFIFLLSTKAGGLGINLTSASVVIIHDLDFNPYVDKQAEDRSHRVGQTKDVTVYKLISENTVEEGMLQIAEDKLRLGLEMTVDGGEMVATKDLKSLLRQALKI